MALFEPVQTYSPHDNELSKAVDGLIPKSLDDLIRINRQMCSLVLSSQEDLDELPALVDSLNSSKATHIIACDMSLLVQNRICPLSHSVEVVRTMSPFFRTCGLIFFMFLNSRL